MLLLVIPLRAKFVDGITSSSVADLDNAVATVTRDVDKCLEVSEGLVTDIEGDNTAPDTAVISFVSDFDVTIQAVEEEWNVLDRRCVISDDSFI